MAVRGYRIFLSILSSLTMDTYRSMLMQVTEALLDTMLKQSSPSTITKTWNLKTGRRTTTVIKGGIHADTNRFAVARSFTKKFPWRCFLEIGVKRTDMFRQTPRIVSVTSTIVAKIFSHIGQQSSPYILSQNVVSPASRSILDWNSPCY